MMIIYLFDLALDIVEKAFSLASIVQHETVGTLFFDEKTWRLQFRIAEPHVLVQVVESVQEVSHVAAQNSENAIVAVLADEVDKLRAEQLH